ncbi:potassium channel family protein [Bdellovibrio sp. ZAP7]|uniref:potassium channel family protein n=1 Tax=Bdellovibrio sp. ZAP7 TaxID=2231053 RepID=UPI00143D6CA7|nr:potassium channel family protein [Bdellovibrio sp. ZAP7]
MKLVLSKPHSSSKRRVPKHKHRKKIYITRFTAMISHPLFWILTLAGNIMIVLGAVLIYYSESFGSNHPNFIDCLMWSTSIVTTIGFIPWVPETQVGKVTAIALMFFGTFFVWSYMAFLVTTLISPALSSIEKEVEDVERELSEIRTKQL